MYVTIIIFAEGLVYFLWNKGCKIHAEGNWYASCRAMVFFRNIFCGLRHKCFYITNIPNNKFLKSSEVSTSPTPYSFIHTKLVGAIYGPHPYGLRVYNVGRTIIFTLSNSKNIFILSILVYIKYPLHALQKIKVFIG